jgi:hypothetical protein
MDVDNFEDGVEGTSGSPISYLSSGFKLNILPWACDEDEPMVWFLRRLFSTNLAFLRPGLLPRLPCLRYNRKHCKSHPYAQNTGKTFTNLPRRHRIIIADRNSEAVFLVITAIAYHFKEHKFNVQIKSKQNLFDIGIT